MSKENIIVVSLFLVLALVGYFFGYLLAKIFGNNKLDDVIHLLGTLFIITTFYSNLKLKLFKYFNIKEEDNNNEN